MSKTLGMLELDRHTGLKVGYRVQPVNLPDPIKGEEGVLKRIYRNTLRQRFSFLVEYTTGNNGEVRFVEYRRQQLQNSKFRDFPSYQNINSTSPGVNHTWVAAEKDDFAHCAFCGTIRVYDYATTMKPCKGLIKVSLR